jgi:hypothetical protein
MFMEVMEEVMASVVGMDSVGVITEEEVMALEGVMEEAMALEEVMVVAEDGAGMAVTEEVVADLAVVDMVDTKEVVDGEVIFRQRKNRLLKQRPEV